MYIKSCVSCGVICPKISRVTTKLICAYGVSWASYGWANHFAVRCGLHVLNRWHWWSKEIDFNENYECN